MAIRKKIALFHPWIKSRGGAERLVLEFLKNTKHQVDIYTWVYDKENTFSEFEKFNITVLSSKISRFFSRMILLRGLYFSLIAPLSKINLEDYDHFLISTSGVAEAIALRNNIKGNTVAYVHTPLREISKEDIAWNLKKEYANPLSKFIYLISTKVYGLLEKISWKKLDTVIFNSELSLSRAKQRNLISHQKVHIIHPPINLKPLKQLKPTDKKYFLYLSRFAKRKRQDLLINAWNEFSKKGNNNNYKLVLAGTIEDARYFEKIKFLAKNNSSVEIHTNFLTDDEVSKLINECSTFIYIPFLEDFGMIPFEVLTFGKPLAAMNKGGYIGLLEEGKHFYPIKEEFSDEKLHKELVSVLKDLSTSKKRGKKYSFNELSSKNFTRKIENVLNT